MCYLEKSVLEATQFLQHLKQDEAMFAREQLLETLRVFQCLLEVINKKKKEQVYTKTL